MKYNYWDEMKVDIKNYLSENNIKVLKNERSDLEDKLYNELFLADGVTGNGSGSYTFNSYKAKEYIMDNVELLKEDSNEFCLDREDIADRFLREDFEYFDVTIRCYLLSQVLNEVLDEVEA